MLQMLIAILLGLSTGTACDMGTPVNWYEWSKGDGQTSRLILRVEPDDAPDTWVFQEADGDYLVFVFREKIDDVLAEGRSDPHGECSVLIEGS